MRKQRKNHFVITSGETFESINISCGGKPVCLDENAVSMPFDLGCIKDKCPNFKALHVVSSKSDKKLSPEYGKYAWAYLEYTNGTRGQPQLIDRYLAKEICKKKVVPDCVYMAAHYPDVLAKLLGQKSQQTKMHNIDETGMRLDAYITVKRNAEGGVEIYVDGKPATTYRGYPIDNIKYIKKVFAWMQGQKPDIEEFHVGAFATRGDKMGQTGNPSSFFGPNAWCRVKFKNGDTSSWVFNSAYDLAANCANNCANGCACYVRIDEDFYAAVFQNKQQNNDMPTDAYITVKPGKTTGSGQNVGSELWKKSQQTKMNNIDETGMRLDAYITVKRNEKGEVEIYVGGKPATTYHGEDIWNIPYIKECFEWMQGQNPDIEEFHIGAFATPGDKMGQTGNPSSGFGSHAWCRLKFKNGKYGAWVFFFPYSSATDCVYGCADYCAYGVRNNAGFHDAVFNAPIVPQNQNSKNELPCPRSNVLAQFKQKVNGVINMLKNKRAQQRTK